MFASKLPVALVMVLVLGGCGTAATTQSALPKANGRTATVKALPAPAAAAPTTPAPMAAASATLPGVNALTGAAAAIPAIATTPTDATATTGATTGIPAMASTLADITATLGTKKNGFLFGAGTFKCTVDVNNPSTVARYGTLTVTFTNGGNPSKTAPQVRPLTLTPGETRTYEFEDTRWSTDDITIEVETKPATPTP